MGATDLHLGTVLVASVGTSVGTLLVASLETWMKEALDSHVVTLLDH
jgi:hypothetical protein